MADPFPGAALQLGSDGDNVKKIQQRLGVQQTGVFGPTTANSVRAFQIANGLTDDGIVGPMTWRALFAGPPLDNLPFPGTELRQGSEGDAVKNIQQRLGVQQTGVFGPTTEMAVTTFQQAQGLDADGIVGPMTWKALFSPASDMTDLSAAALQVAGTLIGVAEQPLGSNRGPMIDRFLRRSGADPGNPWCMAFVYYCVDEAAKAQEAGNPLLKTASCSALFRWAKENDRLVARPETGDIFLCIGGDTGHFHTGFVAGPIQTNDRFITIEGNSNEDGSANGIEVVRRSPGRRVPTCHYVRV